jgi:hypothetical protein
MNLFEFINRQRRWSKNTFGDGARTEGILKHIEKEILEVRDAPSDLSEWCDIVILALDGAWRAGHSPAEICRALESKQAKNMTRVYLRTSDDVPSEHVRISAESGVQTVLGPKGGTDLVVRIPDKLTDAQRELIIKQTD